MDRRLDSPPPAVRRVRRSGLAASLMLLSLGSAACGSDGPAESVQVMVEPSSADVYPGLTLQFAATVTGAATTSVSWSVREGAAGGTIAPGGLYTAPGAAGVFHVVAASVADPAVTGEALVTVTVTPVVAVGLSPSSPTVRVGQTLTFVAVVSGTVAGQSTAVTWSVVELAGGAISADGVYTPPATPGTYHVTATSVADPTKSATTAVTVLAAPATGVPAAAPRVASARFTPALTTVSPSMAVSGLGTAVVWWDRTQDRGGWDVRTNLGYICVNRPVDYVIEASRDDGASWTVLATVTGNTYYTRAHVVDLTGFGQVRMRLTAPAADLGSQYMFVELQVHDARDGVDDWWAFFGDSITTNVFSGTSGQIGLGTGRFGENVNAREATRWPIAHNGGVSQGTMNTYLRVVDGRPLFAWWMDDFPGTFVSIAIGTNDINGYSDHAITAAELDVMQGKMEQIISFALAAGKTVVLPTLRWTNTNPYTGANIAVWNDRLWNTVLPKYPAVLRGPDTYTRSLAQGTAGLVSDQTHLNDLGASLTQEDWADWAMAEIFR